MQPDGSENASNTSSVHSPEHGDELSPTAYFLLISQVHRNEQARPLGPRFGPARFLLIRLTGEQQAHGAACLWAMRLKGEQ
jgi:hypothetical protein